MWPFIFFVLFVVAVVCLVLGLIRPTIFKRYLKENATRKKTSIIFSIAAVVFLYLIGSTNEQSKTIETSSTSLNEQHTITKSTDSSSVQQPSTATPILVKQQESTAPSAESQSSSVQASSKLGTQAFLRLPDNNDPTQIIVLASTKEGQSQVMKSLMANDMQGLIEIPGMFIVPVGSKALVIDTALGLRKVRILTVSDKKYTASVGKAGWVAMEFVVDR